MPHIIIEYSANLSELDISKLLATLHESLASSGVDKARIKTRAVKIDHYVVGDKGTKGAMIHGTLLLLEGRDVPTKDRYSKPLHAAMKNAVRAKDCAVTLEVRDMVRDTYYL